MRFTLKALSIGSDEGRSNARSTEADLFSGFAGVLDPPYDPLQLCRMRDASAELPPNIAAYETNIDSFGHRLEPTLDLTAQDARDVVRDALVLERLFDEQPAVVTDADVSARQLELETVMRHERLRLQLFFEQCGGSISFTQLRRRLRVDLETTGNGYWEVLRDDRGDVVGLVHLRSVDMRLTVADTGFQEVALARRITTISSRRVKQQRRFRRYVQRVAGLNAVWFKELDDPRVMSSRSGRYFGSIDELRAAEPEAAAATEVLHFAVYTPASTPYGVPRWIGATPAVLGSRAAEEVNYAYFDNKAIPPLMLLVDGGTLDDESVERLKEQFEEKVKGRENFHGVLLVQAVPAESHGDPSKISLKLERLQSEQLKDAQFLDYDSRNALKVGAQFRLPKILRGDAADVNRATADAALRQAEMQAFGPERADFDEIINRRLLEPNGIRFHRFASQSPVVTDPPVLVTMAVSACEAGIITPAEARPIISQALSRPLDATDAVWKRLPPRLAALGILAPPPKAGDAAALRARPEEIAGTLRVDELRQALGLEPLGGDAGVQMVSVSAQGATTLDAEAKRVVQLRDRLAEAEARADEAALREARVKEAGSAEP